MPLETDQSNHLTDLAIVPDFYIYGNTFSKPGSSGALKFADGPIDNPATRGEIDRNKLNKNKLQDGASFSPFEENVRDYVLGQLGFPVVRVELTDMQIKTAIDEAISKLYYHCPLFTLQMLVFETTPRVNLYKLPLSVADNLEYVVYKKTLLSIQSMAGTLEFDFFIKYFQDNFLFQNFGVGDFFLLQQHLEQIRKVLGQEGTFDVINNQYLQVSPSPPIKEPVVVVYRALDSNTLHPAYLNWIQRYALAVAKEPLGRIRSKYKNYPSPGGGVQLDGPELLQESVTSKQELIQELLSEIENPPYITMY